MRHLALFLSAALITALSPSAVLAQEQAQPAPQQPGHITGVGGIFFKSKDPRALMAWYRDVLGIDVEAWGGAQLRYDAPKHPPVVIVTAFDLATKEMAPSTREFMLTFAVDDLDAFVARLKAKGVAILKRDDSDPFGKFASILDPDGTRIQFWEPKPE